MNLSEKSAYLKGLMDGLKLDQEAPEGKMISGIVELLQEVTGAIGDLQENDDTMYEVTCPKCGEVLHLDEETLLNDSVDCPKCGEPLEFEFDEDDGL